LADYIFSSEDFQLLSVEAVICMRELELQAEFTCMNTLENKTILKEAGGGEGIKENNWKKKISARKGSILLGICES
jgi:hypothetical protein